MTRFANRMDRTGDSVIIVWDLLRLISLALNTLCSAVFSICYLLD